MESQVIIDARYRMYSLRSEWVHDSYTAMHEAISPAIRATAPCRLSLSCEPCATATDKIDDTHEAGVA